jgi:hypothetical protein
MKLVTWKQGTTDEEGGEKFDPGAAFRAEKAGTRSGANPILHL